MHGVWDFINSSVSKQFSIFTGAWIAPDVAGFESADVVFLSVPGSCSACALGIPVSVPEWCSACAGAFFLSVPGSCSAGADAFSLSVPGLYLASAFGIPVSVPESCSASALEAAVCVLAATSDTCSEHPEVAPALLVGDF